MHHRVVRRILYVRAWAFGMPPVRIGSLAPPWRGGYRVLHQLIQPVRWKVHPEDERPREYFGLRAVARLFGELREVPICNRKSIHAKRRESDWPHWAFPIRGKC